MSCAIELIRVRLMGWRVCGGWGLAVRGLGFRVVGFRAVGM